MPSSQNREFEKERLVIENEILSSRDDAEDLAGEEYLTLVLGKHPLARKIAGGVGAARKVDRDELYAYFKTSFTADRLLVSISGRFSPNDAAAFLETRIPATDSEDPFLGSDGGKPAWKPTRRYKSGGFTQLQIISGVPIENPFSVDLFYASAVFNGAVGDSMSSRLFQNIRERYGYCYTIFSSSTFLKDIGFWTIYASTSPSYANEMVERIFEETSLLSEKGLDAVEIADSKTKLEGEIIMGKEDVENRMKRLARQYFFTGEVLTVDEAIDRVRAVSENDVNGFIARFLLPERFSPSPLRGKDKAADNDKGREMKAGGPQRVTVRMKAEEGGRMNHSKACFDDVERRFCVGSIKPIGECAAWAIPRQPGQFMLVA